jgi:ABC-type transport system involved in multi-copper enzyme maturation permease subunit
MKAVPSPLTSVLTIASLTWTRMIRGRALWVSLLIGALPIMYGGAAKRAGSAAGNEIFVFEVLIAMVLAPMFVASSIGEEIEDRTTTYLWSRPVARWSIIAGKLLTFIPVTVAIVTVSWVLASKVSWDQWPDQRPTIALASGVAVLCVISAGIATLAPKHGMALTICYVLFLDSPLGVLPATFNQISVTHQVRTLAGIWLGEDAIRTPVIALAIISSVWIAIIGLRIRRLEV